jgi:CBS domain-containing protein
MIAEKLISNSLIPLRTSDTGEEALGMMNDFYVRHLPIVNNKQLLGVLSEDDILDFDATEAVGSYSLSLIRPYVKYNDHIYEVMRVLAENKLTVIPVVDGEENYIGLITQEDLLRYFANAGSFSEPGSIIVLEISKRDYALSEISRIVESENAAILSTFITSEPDNTQVEVTLKINRQNTQSIIATFERFDYRVKATFNEADYLDSLRDRYDALMAYLNV